jgi:hypothetical protein
MTMKTIVTREGDAINVEWFTRWYGRLFSLPLLARSLYFFYYVFLALEDGAGRVEPNRQAFR